MAVAFYMDVHVHQAITDGLRRRGVDVLTAQDDDADRLNDDELLNRSTELDRVLFTFDDDLLRESRRRQAENIPFAGVVYYCVNCQSLDAAARQPIGSKPFRP